jgi:hypothetical protein
MPDHDPLRFAEDLSAKLATSSRHVCFLLGAGASRACGLPDVEQLTQKVLAALDEPDKANFQFQLTDHNLEEALSRLRRIASLVGENQKVDGLSGPEASALDVKVCASIVKALDAAEADLTPMRGLAAWVGRARYRSPVELFTVNYDLLIETALEEARIPYFDGFIGALQARFHTELVENRPDPTEESMPSFFSRLWKLHGSVNWEWQNERQVVRRGQAVSEGRVAAIYPSDTKYEESRRVPFVILQDRFRRALLEPETLVVITGYAFGDEHLNELIFDAAARRERSEFICISYSEIPARLAERASSTPNLQAFTGNEAILGGQRAPWRKPEISAANIWTDDEFALRDFRHLATFLARSSATELEKDPPAS